MRLFYYCILLFSLVTLGGCINDADPVDDPSGNPSVVVTDGNVMFSFTVPETSSSLGRASAESSDETVPGNENESRIEKVQLYLFHSETKNFIESFEIGVERVVSDQTVTYRSNQKIKVDPGSYDVFAVANRTRMLNATSVDDFLSHVDEDSYGNGTTDASRPVDHDEPCRGQFERGGECPEGRRRDYGGTHRLGTCGSQIVLGKKPERICYEGQGRPAICHDKFK